MKPGLILTLGSIVALIAPAAFAADQKALPKTVAPKTTDKKAKPAPDADLPLSKDDLFGVSTPEKPAAGAAKDPASSKDELFGVAPAAAKDSAPRAAESSIKWRGFVENTTAYTYDDPVHWSTAVIRSQLGGSGQINDNLKWKATLRLDVDPIYMGSDFYPDAVKRDQRAELLIRETYIDTSVKGWDLRLGRQHIVWGEMVGFYFADVVSARDLRQFILPSFDIQRIPQWAARGEYFFKDSHLELIWIPYYSVDNVGKPGSDFFPVQVPPPAGFTQTFNDHVYPSRNLSNSNYGVRLSTLKGGWDVSGFYYRSTDVQTTFYRETVLVPTPTLVYTPRHDRIWQGGGTVSKDFGSAVFKAEGVYTSGRKFNVTRASEPTGVVAQDTFDYVFGLDFTLPAETRLNVQAFQRVYFEHDPDLIYDQTESGVSALLAGRIGKWEPELLWIQSVNRNEYLVRPRLSWRPEKNLRISLGVDVFGGPAFGVLGRYSNRDRVYLETRYDY